MNNKISYEARVHTIAEEMAIEHLTTNSWSYASISLQNEAIETQTGKAQIAVKHMFDVWMECWSLNNPYIHQEEDGLHYAREQGLVPDTVEPVKKPEEDWKL